MQCVLDFFCNLYFISILNNKELMVVLINLLLCAVLLYFNAKYYIKKNKIIFANLSHIFAHLLLTSINVILMSQY